MCITRGENEDERSAQVSGIGQNLFMGRIGHSEGPFEKNIAVRQIIFYDLDQTPIFGFHLFPQYHSRLDIYRHKICQNVNTRNPSYSKLVFYFQQISPIIIIWE